MRRGIQLVEVMIVLGVVAGPLLWAVHLIRSNAAAVEFNRDRLTARIELANAATRLVREPWPPASRAGIAVDARALMSGPDGIPRLARLVLSVTLDRGVRVEHRLLYRPSRTKQRRPS